MIDLVVKQNQIFQLMGCEVTKIDVYELVVAQVETLKFRHPDVARAKKCFNIAFGEVELSKGDNLELGHGEFL